MNGGSDSMCRLGQFPTAGDRDRILVRDDGYRAGRDVALSGRETARCKSRYRAARVGCVRHGVLCDLRFQAALRWNPQRARARLRPFGYRHGGYQDTGGYIVPSSASVGSACRHWSKGNGRGGLTRPVLGGPVLAVLLSGLAELLPESCPLLSGLVDVAAQIEDCE